MNGYDLTRIWYNYKFNNPDKVKAIHSDFYFYLVDLWNRLGQKEKIGLPTSVTMQILNIGSYNTYKKVLNDLIDFGFIKLIQESKNQHRSKVVALSQTDKATDEALDKAHDKATDEALDTIDKQRTKNKEQRTKDIFSISPEFKEAFEMWVDYKKEKNQKYKSEKSLKVAYEQLLKYSNNDPLIAMEVVRKSIGSNWSGLFELNGHSVAPKKKYEESENNWR